MKSILIAEDDKEINCMLSEYLSSQGYETLTVLNGLEAVRTVREQDSLSLLILDLMLPFKSGILCECTGGYESRLRGIKASECQYGPSGELKERNSG